MTAKRTPLGKQVEAALGEVLAHTRGEIDLACRLVDDPSAARIRALRKRLKLSRRKFAERFGLDARAGSGRAGVGGLGRFHVDGNRAGAT